MSSLGRLTQASKINVCLEYNLLIHTKYRSLIQHIKQYFEVCIHYHHATYFKYTKIYLKFMFLYVLTGRIGVGKKRKKRRKKERKNIPTPPPPKKKEEEKKKKIPPNNKTQYKKQSPAIHPKKTNCNLKNYL